MIAQQIKSAIRQVGAEAYYATKYFLKHLQGKVIILAYHRILPEKEVQRYFVQPGIYVQEDVFDTQMKFLKEYFSIISFAELLDLWNNKAISKDQRYCVITFDDGWLDNYLYAYPILQKYNIPATIFLPTAFIGTNYWFWPEKLGYLLKHYFVVSGSRSIELIPLFSKEKKRGIRSIDDIIESIIEKYKESMDKEIEEIIEKLSKGLNIKIPSERILLNWKEIEEMSKHRISFGSHSCNHKILTKLSANEIEKELKDSMCTLQGKKINYIPVFCYPNGNYNQGIIKQVKATGYRSAVSILYGYEEGSPQDLFSLKRISIHNDITYKIPLFVFHISGLTHL